MLRSMLLHVIDPAVPIDLARNGPDGQLRGRVVNHWLFAGRVRSHRQHIRTSIDNFDNVCMAQPPDIMRLPSRSRVKRGSVEYHFPAIAFALARNDVSVEFSTKRVVI